MDPRLSPAQLEKQGTHTLLTTGLSVILGLLLSIVVSRTLGPAGKGVLDVTSASASLFALVLGGSINAALTHRVAREGKTPGRLVGQLAGWAFLAGSLTLTLLGIRPDWSARLGLLPPDDAPFWLGFVAVSVAFGVWAASLRGILIGQQSLIRVNRLDLAIKAGLLLAFGAVAWRGSAQPKSFALIGAAGAVVLALAFWWSLPRPAGAVPGTWAALLAIALPVHGTNILHFINQRADIFFVQAWHGTAQVGLYGLAVSLAQCVLLLSSGLALPLLPQVSAADSTGAAAVTARTCRLFMALSLLTSGALALGGTWLVPAVFGRDFSGSLPSLLILLPGMIGFGLTNILISHFVGRDESHTNLWISLAALGVTILGNLTLTRSFGAVGAAITSTVAYGLAGGLSLWFFCRGGSVSLASVLQPTRADWRSAVTLVGRFRF